MSKFPFITGETKLKVLLAEPRRSKKYHTHYPPLGLLKLAAYHHERGDSVRLVSGLSSDELDPDVIHITSLFTYAWEPVHELIDFYAKKYKRARIIVGGIYASLCHDHVSEAFGDRIEVWQGLVSEIEDILPAYWLIPEWKTSILFSSRGCIRKCTFCSVSQLEPQFEARKTIKHLVSPDHRKVVFWDNNFLASPHWENILTELADLRVEVDFNQGLDARLLTERVTTYLMRLKVPIVRLAYDSAPIKESLRRAIDLLKRLGVDGRRIIVYCLYNYDDTPEEFLDRIQDLIGWEVVSYPMRYQSLKPEPKDTYVSSNWTREQLEMVAQARRVIGFGGAFPPYEGLKAKFLGAKNFEAAFALKPRQSRVQP
jgi:hypothetical protein